MPKAGHPAPPARRDLAVGVDEGNDLGVGGGESRVARRSRPAWRGVAQDSRPGGRGALRRAITRPVIDDDHRPFGGQRRDQVRELRSAVEDRHDRRHRWVLGAVVRQGM